jgi:hypothetical protein
VREEVDRMAWGKQESRGAGRAGPVPLSTHGVRRVGSVKISEEFRGDTVKNWDSCHNGGVNEDRRRALESAERQSRNGKFFTGGNGPLRSRASAARGNGEGKKLWPEGGVLGASRRNGIERDKMRNFEGFRGISRWGAKRILERKPIWAALTRPLWTRALWQFAFPKEKPGWGWPARRNRKPRHGERIQGHGEKACNIRSRATYWRWKV